MTEPEILPLGRDALDWVNRGGKPSRVGLLPRCLMRWQSYWFEHNLGLQRRLPPVGHMSSDPVFIMGLWRSGTTYLHNLLSACPGLLAPRMWQCQSPASFRLRSPPARGPSAPRLMDLMKIDNLSPQEDEFALLALGVPTVYRGFIDPRRLLELTQWLDPAVWIGDGPAGWIELWRGFLDGVADGVPGRLLIKSPNHSFRIRALARVFPGVRCVWCVRDPVETFLSNQKMWRAMFRRYALWPWDESVLDEFLVQALEYAAQSLAVATDILPRQRLVVVRFEDFTAEPQHSLEQVNRRLSLGAWAQMSQEISTVVAAAAGYRVERYPRVKLSPRAEKAALGLGHAYQTALASHGL